MIGISQILGIIMVVFAAMGVIVTLKKPTPITRQILIGVCACLLVIAIVLICLPTSTACTSPTCKILSPVPNSTVSEGPLQVNGYLDKEMCKGESLYIVRQLFGMLWYPDKAHVYYNETNSRWEFDCTIWFASGQGKQIWDIIPVLVDSAADAQFESWKERAQGTGNWTPINRTDISQWGQWWYCCGAVTILQD